MNLEGGKLIEKYGELMNEIKLKSSRLSDFIMDEGLDENNAERLLKAFVADEDLNKHSSFYRQLIKDGTDIDYIEAVSKISNADEVEIEYDDYKDFIAAASERKMPIEQFIQIVNSSEYINILDEIETAEIEKVEPEKTETDEKQEPAADENKTPSDSEEVHPEIITHTDDTEKNFFTQTIEDLLGIPTKTLENEEEDGNLDALVKSITDAISEDKRKTNLINNLRRVVILANKQVIRMTERIQASSSTEQILREQIGKLTAERDEYKKKYEEINGKISELSSLAALASTGVKRIE